MAWQVILEQGFTRMQQQTAREAHFDTMGKAYDFILLHYFQQERKLFQEQIIRNEMDEITSIHYKGINDEGYSACARIARKV